MINTETCQEFSERKMALALEALKARVLLEGSVRLEGAVGQLAYNTVRNGRSDTIPSELALNSAGLKLEVLLKGNELWFAVVVVSAL